MRIIVLPEFRQKRLGSWMLLDLIHLAMDKGLRELRADFVVGIEDAAIEAAYKLDFFKKAPARGVHHRLARPAARSADHDQTAPQGLGDF
ncbi:MAG: GNAT family N-acetyltransferase [Desulfobacterales bacterium]|nr:GNAT family N-acetyltransferase [Desulfobacterales bacterium]